MVLGALIFATMGVCVKFASVWFGSAEIVFYRGLIGIVFLWLLARSRGVPLATAMTLNYMSSVWIAAFLVGGALLAWVPVPGRDGSLPKPPLQAPLVLTVLAGFAGVVLMLKPSVDYQQGFAGLMGLLSGLTAAFAYMQVIALSRIGEPETRTVFYFALGSFVAGGLGMVLTGVSAWEWRHALWLLPVGLLAAVGQLCMTRAYASAKTESGTLLVANLQYSGIVFAALYSVLLFGDRIDAAGWAGMALIVASGIAATVLRQRAVPKAPAEEH